MGDMDNVLTGIWAYKKIDRPHELSIAIQEAALPVRVAG